MNTVILISQLFILVAANNEITEAAAVSLKDFECGKQHILRSGRIVGGDDAYHGEYPWAVSIRFNGHHYCGGVLLNNEWVMSAAHCVVGYIPKNFWVRLGSLGMKNKPEESNVDIPVSLIKPHENYARPHAFFNDIALLKLKRPVEYTNYILPVCLPNPGDPETIDFYNGVTGTVVGWGWISGANTVQTRGMAANNLQKVNLPIIDNENCTSWFRSKGKNVKISAKQFCAGFENGGKDACRGDSGGPMVFRNATTNQHIVIGIVSAGIGCALPQLPGLYTRVNAYLPWINKYISF